MVVMVFIVIVPDADGYAIRTVPSSTSALPFSITLKPPVPLRVKEVSDLQPIKGGLVVAVIFADAEKLTLCRLVQFMKAIFPKLVACGKLALCRGREDKEKIPP